MHRSTSELDLNRYDMNPHEGKEDKKKRGRSPFKCVREKRLSLIY